MPVKTFYTHKHYLFEGYMPIRVLYARSDGLKAGAMIPDRETGKLRYAHRYLRHVEEDLELDEISEEEFDRRCETIFSESGSGNKENSK